MDEFDHVVVGGGSAGCIVAAELSADATRRVLLLEAGDAAERWPETSRADGYRDAFANDALMWDRMTPPQPGCGGRRIFVGTGRGLGGSGSVNAMVYTRGDASDYDTWGVDGWRFTDVAAEFGALESTLHVHRRAPTRFSEACLCAAERAGMRRQADLNDGAVRGGVGYTWMNQEGEARRSSYVAFLAPHVGRPNLRVVTGAAATRVLFDSARRAWGVDYVREGERVTVRARGGVVSCAGALESPRLLMLSGVGPGAHLREVGVPVVADVPGVGQNLHDHPNVPVFFLGREPTDTPYVQLYGFDRVGAGQGLPPQAPDVCLVFYPARGSLREGMLRLVPGMVLPPSLYARGAARGAVRALVRGAFEPEGVRRFVARVWGIVVILGKPASRGTLTLRGPDAATPAVVDPAYLADETDVDTLVRGIEQARRIAAAPPLARWGARPLMPGRRADLAAYVRQNVITTYHFAGTCRMGGAGDAHAVVDAGLRVRGVTGLTVADASILPIAPVAALNAPSMLIGLRASRILREGV